MKLKKAHIIGIVFGLIIAVVGVVFFSNKNGFDILFFLLGIAAAVIALPFVVDLVVENKRGEELDQMFLEFSRNLAESVNTGTPISKSIVNMKGKNYGPLTPYIGKLANQISIGIPVGRALETFAYEVGSPVIQRAVGLIHEAERAGGEIDYILESVANSISEVEKLKKERKAAIYNLVVQGYVIFFIFIGIMLVMQFKILPLLGGIGGINLFGGNLNSIANAGTSAASSASSGAGLDVSSLGRSFLFLLLAQGFFAGLTIGKLAEGKVKAGIKHSFLLMIAALLISTGAQFVFGG